MAAEKEPEAEADEAGKKEEAEEVGERNPGGGGSEEEEGTGREWEATGRGEEVPKVQKKRAGEWTEEEGPPRRGRREEAEPERGEHRAKSS